ncbi:hypothetical protein PO903_09835 [Paenibacillus sp. PK4536]|uniref:hypothetical protein n=1 Tax=Paenibacillus sp. PK4536 TaxID=3024576 RepID=UPI0023588DB5|nr:hypothetical protein [Paenibacillus sp. PK4536]WIM41145.1 hypothetical protein PO903_09835 [Paenibacillus sp. PK4536]
MNEVKDCWNINIHKQMIEYSSRLLWRFIQPNAKESEAEDTFLNLTGLNRKELDMLADIRFLLSKDVENFVNRVAPEIINRLLKNSNYNQVIDRGQVRGKIHWQKTISERAMNGYDKNIYVYTKKRQSFDLPENQLFLYILNYIYEKSNIFSSEEYFYLTWYSEVEVNDKWIKKVSIITTKINRLLKNSYIKQIIQTKKISTEAICLSKKSRILHYKELGILAERLLFSKEHPIYFLKEELNSNILEPLNKDTLYEIAVLFKVIQTAVEIGWNEKEIGLIGGKSKAVSILKKENMTLKLYFQKLPIEMSKCSIYGEIIKGYGLSERLRRPDIILEFDNGTIKKFLIIEVKRSSNPKYLVDGTYKLLAYIKDFEGVSQKGYKLKGLLIAWNKIGIREYNSENEIHLFNWRNLHKGLLISLSELSSTK